MFAKLLIANRAEIACRVAATARRMGIQTVAVYSDADVDAKHVAACDTALRIGPPPARESYLLSERIIEAARASGAQAVHPGYGFLSENAGFAAACAKAGLIFIGPPPEAILAMGSKSAAKALMEKAGVPLVPGYHGEEQDPALLALEAEKIGYPVLIKASSGGGGKGMRIVEAPGEFSAALASCKREARAAFGDDMVLVETYLTRPRHIEIQVFADHHGQCVYLFERDCSVQRRHQKVLEEAPAPGLSENRREAMGQAAVAAARAVGYVGAGTVEFIVNQDGSFYFMEMNTRLQVEHPVTEMITGFDLVEWQFRVAAGEPLPRTQSELVRRGHALEARIYAENPERGFLPATGVLQRLHLPDAVEFTISREPHDTAPAAVRIDSGVRQADRITAFYDPMIAKLIVWGRDRNEALEGMLQALARTQIVGLATNVAFLARLVASEPFRQADLDTGLIERHHETLFPPAQTLDWGWIGLAVGAVLLDEGSTAGSDPWSRRDGWRLAGHATRTFSFAHAENRYDAQLTYGDGALSLGVAGRVGALVVSRTAGEDLRIVLDGQLLCADLEREGSLLHLFHGGRHIVIDWLDAHHDAFEAEAEEGRLTAPMPGKIVALLASPGTRVERGTPLLVMEAMKMEHTIAAPFAGVVRLIRFGVGDQVAEGEQLLEFEVEAPAS
jgi:3-methylcrotonyl-CoA carboxylase alpha subunit